MKKEVRLHLSGKPVFYPFTPIIFVPHAPWMFPLRIPIILENIQVRRLSEQEELFVAVKLLSFHRQRQSLQLQQQNHSMTELQHSNSLHQRCAESQSISIKYTTPNPTSNNNNNNNNSKTHNFYAGCDF